VARESAKTKRKREFDRAIAEALATLDEIHALPSDDPPPSAPNVAALVRRELARERAEAERAEEASFRCPVGGGCWRCGIAACYTFDERGERIPGWVVDGDRASCQWCENDVETFGRVGDTEDDQRVRQAARLLGVGLPLRAVGDARSFRACKVWFNEHDAEPVFREVDRFSHIDLTELRRQWDVIAEGRDVPEPEPEILTGRPPCPECACTEGLAVGHYVNEHTGQIEPMAVYCLDCWVAWILQSGSRMPEWWMRRRAGNLPGWARQFEQVPA
jgi:hypothetical protein